MEIWKVFRYLYNLKNGAMNLFSDLSFEKNFTWLDSLKKYMKVIAISMINNIIPVSILELFINDDPNSGQSNFFKLVGQKNDIWNREQG